ncbi:MAG: hypothetical protein DMG55_27255, partial [Acidobacteria bacterium]
MKKLYCVVLVGALFQPMFQLHAQEKPKAEEHVKVPTPIKVQIVFTELDGDKRVSSMPYSFTVVSDERMGGKYSTSIRTGIRVPIETDGKEQKTTYLDIGSNIDCGIETENDSRFHVYLTFERSALYPNKSGEGEKLVTNPGGNPLVRT